ncbi:MAG: tetratricopeptide repeat protein, partial [Allomuricauda sp.]
MPKLQLSVIAIIIFLSSCDLTSSEQYFNRARDLEIEGKYKKANAMLDKAIEKNPKFRGALLNRGVNKSILGDYKGAISDYQKLLEFDSDNSLALLNSGNNYKRLQNYEMAISSYNKALKTEWAIKPDSIVLKLDINSDFDKDSDYQVSQLEIIYERGIAFVLNK